MIHELVQNAVKQGGKIVRLSLRAGEEHALLMVCDDRPGGTPEAVASHLAGTGLEMAMTLARHDLNGDISFENLEGGGTCVKVTFVGQSDRSSFF